MVHPGSQLAEVESGELGPFSDDNKSVGVFGHRKGIIAVENAQVGMLLPAGIHGDGVVGPDPGTRLDEAFGDLQTWCIAQIVRVWFEGQAEKPDGASLEDKQLFLQLLGGSRSVSKTLELMVSLGLLQCLIPELGEAFRRPRGGDRRAHGCGRDH